MSNIHESARRLSAQRGISLPDAYSELARRSLAKRRRRACGLGVLHPTRADRAAFSAVESPRYWWEDRP